MSLTAINSCILIVKIFYVEIRNCITTLIQSTFIKLRNLLSKEFEISINNYDLNNFINAYRIFFYIR